MYEGFNFEMHVILRNMELSILRFMEVFGFLILYVFILGIIYVDYIYICYIYFSCNFLRYWKDEIYISSIFLAYFLHLVYIIILLKENMEII